MATTTINCDFRDAVGVPLAGYIVVGTGSWLMKDGSTKSVTTLPGRVEFTDGSCTLGLETSEIEQVTYSFEVYHYDEVITSDPETGEPVITVSDFPLVPKFYARVPSSPTPISFNALTKQSGVSRDNIDTAISAIVRRLYNEDIFWARLQENLFVSKGYYEPEAWYTRGDVITWDGGSYLYYFNERAQGVLPSEGTHWQKLADRGLTGAGTTGNDAPFDAGWDGQTDAPSRNAVYDALQQYALQSTVSGFAPLNSPVFTGTPTRTVALVSTDRSTQLASTTWVQTLLDEVRKAITPVGTVTSYAGLSAPTGWVFCDGRTLSQSTYSALYTVLGTTYNTGGEAGGTFRIPDLRGRVCLAPDAMGGVAANRVTSNNGLANSGGSESVTLTVTQMPLHSHNISLIGFNATGLAETLATGYGAVAFGGKAPTAGLVGTAGNRTIGSDTNPAIADRGSGTSHTNLQPYLSLNAIIYTGV